MYSKTLEYDTAVTSVNIKLLHRVVLLCINTLKSVTSLDVIVTLAIWFRLIVISDTVTDNQLLMLSSY